MINFGAVFVVSFSGLGIYDMQAVKLFICSSTVR